MRCENGHFEDKRSQRERTDDGQKRRGRSEPRDGQEREDQERNPDLSGDAPRIHDRKRKGPEWGRLPESPADIRCYEGKEVRDVKETRQGTERHNPNRRPSARMAISRPQQEVERNPDEERGADEKSGEVVRRDDKEKDGRGHDILAPRTPASDWFIQRLIE